MASIAPSIAHRVENLRKLNCLHAAEMAADLQKKVEELKSICARPTFAGTSFPCAEMYRQLQDVIDLAERHSRSCQARDGGDECGDVLCPLAAAPMEVACLGVSIAILKVQASAVHLYHVAR